MYLVYLTKKFVEKLIDYSSTQLKLNVNVVLRSRVRIKFEKSINNHLSMKPHFIPKS